MDPLIQLQIDLLYKLFDKVELIPFSQAKPGTPVAILCDHTETGFGMPKADYGPYIAAELLQGTYLRREQVDPGGKYGTLPNGQPHLVDIVDLNGQEVWMDFKEDGTGHWPTGGPVHDVKLGAVTQEYTVTADDDGYND